MASFYHIRRIGELSANSYLNVGDEIRVDGFNIYSRYLWEESLLTTAGRISHPNIALSMLHEVGKNQMRAAMNTRLCKQMVEYVFESVRYREFSHCPTRQSCIFATKSFESAMSWLSSFGAQYRYQILEIEPCYPTEIFEGDATLVCYDTLPLIRVEVFAQHYWSGTKTKKPLEECLISGSAEVVKILKSE